MLIDLANISVSFSERILFQNVNLRIEETDRIGLVGSNGEGKSTLLNLLADELSPSTGERIVKKNLQIGYLKQNSGLDSTATIYQEMLHVFSPLLQVQSKMKELSQKLAGYQTNLQKKQSDYLTLSTEYGELLSYFESNDGYQIETKIHTVLNGMGFRGINQDTPCKTLSGGEKTRLALAKLLLQSPDILMLDEPTNHLDMETLQWLEDYLSSYQGALIIVSHDRYFLDQLCTRIWALENTQVTAYRGNYSKYRQSRELFVSHQQKEHQKQQIQIQKLTDYIARNKVRATTAAMAKSREKTLERIRQKNLSIPIEKKPIRVQFVYAEEPVKEVLQVESISLFAGGNFSGHLLMPPFDFSLLKGDKVAIIGSNGVGKSTFLKILMNEYPLPLNARIRWGLRTKVAYYSQDFSSLSPFKTVKEELWDHTPLSDETSIRTLLASVGFIGEDVNKKVEVLSGGEKSRLKLAILMLQQANVLLLDEPTNHLDLTSREILEAALLQFQGTVLLVSHDRYLLSKVPNKIVEFSLDGPKWFEGSYKAYQEIKKLRFSNESRKVTHEPFSDSAKAYFRTKQQRAQDAVKRRRFQFIEQEIPCLEEKLQTLSRRMNEVSNDYSVYCEVVQEFNEEQQHLENLMDEWAELAESFSDQ